MSDIILKNPSSVSAIVRDRNATPFNLDDTLGENLVLRYNQDAPAKTPITLATGRMLRTFVAAWIQTIQLRASGSTAPPESIPIASGPVDPPTSTTQVKQDVPTDGEPVSVDFQLQTGWTVAPDARSIQYDIPQTLIDLARNNNISTTLKFSIRWTEDNQTFDQDPIIVVDPHPLA